MNQQQFAPHWQQCNNGMMQNGTFPATQQQYYQNMYSQFQQLQQQFYQFQQFQQFQKYQQMQMNQQQHGLPMATGSQTQQISPNFFPNQQFLNTTTPQSNWNIQPTCQTNAGNSAQQLPQTPNQQQKFSSPSSQEVPNSLDSFTKFGDAFNTQPVSYPINNTTTNAGNEGIEFGDFEEGGVQELPKEQQSNSPSIEFGGFDSVQPCKTNDDSITSVFDNALVNENKTNCHPSGDEMNNKQNQLRDENPETISQKSGRNDQRSFTKEPIEEQTDTANQQDNNEQTKNNYSEKDNSSQSTEPPQILLSGNTDERISSTNPHLTEKIESNSSECDKLYTNSLSDANQIQNMTTTSNSIEQSTEGTSETKNISNTILEKQLHSAECKNENTTSSTSSDKIVDTTTSKEVARESEKKDDEQTNGIAKESEINKSSNCTSTKETNEESQKSDEECTSLIKLTHQCTALLRSANEWLCRVEQASGEAMSIVKSSETFKNVMKGVEAVRQVHQRVCQASIIKRVASPTLSAAGREYSTEWLQLSQHLVTIGVEEQPLSMTASGIDLIPASEHEETTFCHLCGTIGTPERGSEWELIKQQNTGTTVHRICNNIINSDTKLNS